MTLGDLRLDYSAGGDTIDGADKEKSREWDVRSQQGEEQQVFWDRGFETREGEDGAGSSAVDSGGGGWRKRKAEKERERVGVGKRRDKGKGRAVATAGCGWVPGHCPVGYQPASVEDGSDGDEAKGCAYGFDKGKGVEEW